MSRVIKKKIKIPVGIKDQNLAEMFNQMLGTGAVNMNIAYPRYARIKGIVKTLLELFEMFNASAFMKRQKEFAFEQNEIAEFISRSREACAELFKIDFREYEWNLSLVEDEQKQAFAEVYEKMKKSEIINTFIIMCDRLVTYKRYIGDANNLNPVFISTMAGIEFCPFPFTRLNVKYIFSLDAIGDKTKEFFLTVLNKALELSYKLWGEITSPDINVDEFVDVIMANIKEIQRRPELSRCQKAFKKIEESVHLLKGRFNNYYRDFIQTKNSTIMMEHFILDVSKSTKADVETTRQFRQIIGFYRKIAQEQVVNPKVKMLFDKVNESFKELERNTNNLVNIEDMESDGSGGDTSSDSGEATTEPGPESSTTNTGAANTEAVAESIEDLVDFIEGKKQRCTKGTKLNTK